MTKLLAAESLLEHEEKTLGGTKKEFILELYRSGTTDIETIGVITGSRPSYVGSVLHREGLIDNYFDLYTSSTFPMNVYSKYFKGKLGFKNVFAARKAVKNLEELYLEFEENHDRAGQHHTMEMALTMLNRARWIGKLEEAEIYRRWLVSKLGEPLIHDVKEAIKTDKTSEHGDGQIKLKLVA